MKRFLPWIFLLILIGGFVVRLYRFSGPIADWQSWRQADTSAVSRTFVKTGINFLYPTFEDISNVPSGLDNPHGYRYVEFPLYNAAQAGLFMLFGHFTLEEWGRLVTIVASLSTALFLFLFLRRRDDPVGGLMAAFFFCFLPFDIYYGRSILPDVSTGSTAMAAIYFFDSWIVSKNMGKKITFLFLSLLFTTISLLLKPFAAFLLIPILSLCIDTWGWKFFLRKELYLFLLTLIPLAWWRIWMQQHPEGIASNVWLFNEGNVRFKPIYFYWVYGERIGKLILGYWGISLLVTGLLNGFTSRLHEKKQSFFLYSFLLGSFLYLSVIARGNLQHDYYQILIMPSLALFMGIGARALWFYTKERLSLTVARGVLLIITVFTLAFSWFYVRDYFNINNSNIIYAGQAVDHVTPADAKVIALYNGDTSFLYATNRQGWASFEKPLPDMIHMGASYMAIVNPSPQDVSGFGHTYQIVASSSAYLILKLQ